MYDMIFIYLQQLDIRPVEVVGKLVKNRNEVAIYKRGNNTQTTKNTVYTNRKQTVKTSTPTQKEC
jgi:hypothetical protein